MTARQLRRAAERKQRKLARKEALIPDSNATAADSATTPIQSPEWGRPTGAEAVEIRAEINRVNSQLSTGPRTPEGKSKSSLNAVKTGLTGRTVLLPSDDADRYEQHVQSFFDELAPAGPRESALVQSLADSAWRLARIPGLEMAIYAYGRTQFAAQFAHEDSSVQPSLIEMHTFLAYEKQLRNLHIQESRLRRQREKDTAELRQLQAERVQKEKDDLDVAAKLYLAARRDGKSFNPAESGFEFSIADIERFLEGVRAANLARQTMKEEIQSLKSLANAA